MEGISYSVVSTELIVEKDSFYVSMVLEDREYPEAGSSLINL